MGKRRINTPLIRGWIETTLDTRSEADLTRINTPLIRGWIETITLLVSLPNP